MLNRRRQLKAEGRLNEELQAAANLAQDEIETLMKKRYSIDEAKEVASPLFILLAPENPDAGLTPEQVEELAEKEREYQKNLALDVKPPQARNVPAFDYRITDETELGKGTEGVKYRDNLAAIETLKKIEREERRPTPEEQPSWPGLLAVP